MPQNVTAVAVHPGMVATNLADSWIAGSDILGEAVQPVLRALLNLLGSTILEPPEQAARTVMFAALAPAQQVSCWAKNRCYNQGVDLQGLEPWTYRMQSDRSTTGAPNPTDFFPRLLFIPA